MISHNIYRDKNDSKDMRIDSDQFSIKSKLVEFTHRWYHWLKLFPMMIFISVVIVLILICIFDFPWVLSQTKKFTEVVINHPNKAVVYASLLLTILVSMSIPVSYIMIALGFAYSKVY